MDSTSPTYPGEPSPAAIPDEENKSGKKKKKKAQEVFLEGTIKCHFCPRMFSSLRARGGHLKAHRNLRKIQNQKPHMLRRLAPRPPAGPPVRVWSTLSNDPALRSACINLHAARFNAGRKHYIPADVGPVLARTCGHAAQPSSAAKGNRGTVGKGHSGSLPLRKVNLDAADVNNSFISPLSDADAMAFSPSQTGSGSSGLAQTFVAVPTVASDDYGRTGDGVHLGRHQAMPEAEVNQEETADGIDLTLRL